MREAAVRHCVELEKNGCALETFIDPGIRASVDPARIEQVMDNLFSNVVKYAPGKPVKVALMDQEGRAVISVEDQGPGIPPEQIEKVFERFERATLSRSMSGLGLGLYIVKQIVAGHGGTVQAENGTEIGCKLTVKIPLA